jgi:hypothetical protein
MHIPFGPWRPKLAYAWRFDLVFHVSLRYLNYLWFRVVIFGDGCNRRLNLLTNR